MPSKSRSLVRGKPVGSPLHIQILRDGQLTALTLKVEQLPTEEVAQDS
jgi:hypothetical protein